MNAATLEEVALSMVSGLGCASLRKLMDVVGSVRELYALPANEVYAIFGTHRDIAARIVNRSTLARAEAELRYCQEHNIVPLFYTSPDYPQRLNRSECTDCPPLIYTTGGCDLNAKRMVSIVGTRRATYYGRDATARLVEELKPYDVTVVSGLAYGIDAAAHTSSVEHGMPTVAVMGHGLDRVYPPENTRLAHDMVEHGGALLTEYISGTRLNARYFPARNRIIAAMSDAVVVVEASEKGGALITANIANGYHRDVFAVPGRVTDTYSKGCNNLIASNKAIMVRNAADIAAALNWPELGSGVKQVQTELFATLSTDEEAVTRWLRDCESLSLDELGVKSGLSFTKLASILMDLELKNIVRSLPGKRYNLI